MKQSDDEQSGENVAFSSTKQQGIVDVNFKNLLALRINKLTPQTFSDIINLLLTSDGIWINWPRILKMTIENKSRASRSPWIPFEMVHFLHFVQLHRTEPQTSKYKMYKFFTSLLLKALTEHERKRMRAPKPGVGSFNPVVAVNLNTKNLLSSYLLY